MAWLPTSVGGGGALWTLIETKDIVSTTATVSWSGIAATFDELVIIGHARSNRASDIDEMLMRFGAGSIDSGNNYDSMGWAWDDNTGTFTTLSQAATSMNASRFSLPADGITDADTFGTVWILVSMYRDTDHDAAYTSHCGFASADTAVSTKARLGYSAGKWRNTAAVDYIDLFWTNGSFVAGTELRLYGIG